MTSKFHYAEAIYRTKMDQVCQSSVQLPTALLESHHGDSYSFVLKVLTRVSPPDDNDIVKLERLTNKVFDEYKAANARRSKSASEIINRLPTDLQSVSLADAAGPSSIPVGFLLDEEEFIVGSYDPLCRTEPQILLRAPLQFALNTKTNQVDISPDGEKGRDWKHYNLLKLLRAQPTFTHTVGGAESASYVRTEQLISSFFTKVFELVKNRKNASTIPSLAIVLSFTSTALERQRLKEGARAAGVHKVRILSSPVANAVSYAVISGHFKAGGRAEEKFILSVQYLKQSFSMAIVRLAPGVISTRCAYGLENMPQGQESNLKSAHGRLFQTSTVEGKYQEQIIAMYKQALERLFSESSGCQIATISTVLASATKETVMNVTLGKYLQKKITLLGYEKGPLLGACLLAAQMSPQHVPVDFPSKIKVVEVSRADLQVNFNGQEWKVNFRNQKFNQGLVFYHAFDPVGADKSYVVVQEEYCEKPKVLQDACIRFVSVEAITEKVKKVQMNGTVDEDGVYTLSLECPVGVRAKLSRPDEQFASQLASRQRVALAAESDPYEA